MAEPVLTNRLRSFLSNRHGNILVLTAAAMVFLVGLVAMVVDAGSFYYQKNRLQSAADMAALAAGGDIAHARAAAVAALSSNGYPASALQSITPGVYDSTAALGQRFTTGGSNPNAVQVNLLTYAPMQFSKIFKLAGYQSSNGEVAIGASGVGATPGEASFAIGTTLASLNGGVLNAVLGGLLGSSISLSLMDYNSLLSTNIDLFQFSNALATRANLTGATYSSVASGSFTVGDILRAGITAAQGGAASAGAIGAMQAMYHTLSSSALAQTISLSSLVNFGPYGANSVGGASPVSFQISALNLFSSVLQIANGSHQLALDLGVSVPPVADVTLTMTVGEPPVGTSMNMVGATGASAFTAQTRLLLTAQISLPGMSNLVNLPILIDLAAGQATLAGIQCDAPSNSGTNVTLNVTPSVVDAWIGNITNAMLTSTTTAPNPGAATILNLANIATVTGRANTSISNLTPTAVNFSYAQITSATGQNTSTTDFVSSLLYNLFANLVMNVNVIGLPILAPAGLTTTIATALAAATAPLDTIISSVLTALGLSLGQATTWVTGVKCGTPSIVQ